MICRTLGRSRGWLYYRRRRPRAPRPARRPELEALIATLLQGLPATYGVRRVHALLLRQGIPCNRKTVYAILRRKSWLSCTRQRTARAGRLHEGRVAVPTPNRRWASDITGLTTWDGQKRRLAIILDCADRSVVAWRLAPRITAEDLSEVVREAIFARFGDTRTQAQGIEFLSDNGPEYLAQSFRRDLEAWGLVPCRTPCRSPESNGVAEAFFGSLKRDYVYQSCLETVADLERQLPGWIANYNQVAPHSALGMRSPAQFYAEWMAKTKLPLAQN